MIKLRKKTPMENFKFCVGSACNYVDMETGKMYHIQEYAEEIRKGKDPDKIKVTYWDNANGPALEYVTPEQMKDIMADKEPDPRY